MAQMIFPSRRWYWFVTGAALVALLSGPSVARAARYHFSPATGSFGSGERFSVQVLIDTQGQVINAGEAILSFPTNLLRVEGVSVEGSAFKFWSQDPVFSNTAGNINFGGGLPAPGAASPAVKVVTITFRALGAGTAALRIENGAVLLNDGVGSNVLTGSQEGRYTMLVGESAPPPAPPPAETEGIPAKPVIISTTHPEGAWSNLARAEFSWTLPAGTTGVSYALLGASVYSLPDTSKGAMAQASYDLTGFEDGTWYFFVKFRNANGWGAPARRAVKIDRTPPEPFSLVRRTGDDATDPAPRFAWDAKDLASGVARSEVRIGDGKWLPSSDLARDDDGAYILPLQAPGARAFAVRAYDHAGNTTEAATSFAVAPLQSPTIVDYTRRLRSPREIFAARGKAPSGAGVNLYLKRSDAVVTFRAEADDSGEWSAEYRDALPAGTWQLSAETVDERGALSYPTESVPVKVESWFGTTAGKALRWGGLVLLLIVLAGVLAAAALWTVHRLRLWRLFLKKDLQAFKRELERDLAALHADMESLDRKDPPRGASALERVVAKIKKTVAHAEEDVSEEITKLDNEK